MGVLPVPDQDDRFLEELVNAVDQRHEFRSSMLRRLPLHGRWVRRQWHSRVEPGRIAIGPTTDRRPEPRPLTFTTEERRRRAQVCPRGGRRVNPASSSKQMQLPQGARTLLPPPGSLPSRR